MKILIFISLFIIGLLFSNSQIHAQNNGRISGTVTDKATQQKIVAASIQLQGTKIGSITDSLGRFRITGIPLNTYSVQISSLGYNSKTLYNIIIGAGNETTINVELETATEQLQDVVISATRKTVRAASLETPLSVQRLTSEEIKSSPGGNFDISKVIQTLPGVGGGSQGGSFRNDIIIRGGAPNENVFYLDGIEIPVINHFQTQGSSGGPQGILNVSFIEDVKLSSSAFDARYNNALSSVFQFKQKNGNPYKLQGNVRLSATEIAATFDGPLSKNKKTTFLASARRSYLQLLFSAIDLPIRPNYWDFQTKVTHQINKSTTLSFIGVGAIDEFYFAKTKKATPEKLYVLNSSPTINQWNYTAGFNLKKLINNGFINMALSRNAFDNAIKRYENNETKDPSEITLSYLSRETENKFRFDVNKSIGGWKYAYGFSTQYVQYANRTFNIIRKELRDSANNIIQPKVVVDFTSPLNNFWRYGLFLQISKRVFDDRLAISTGLRTDMNSFTETGNQPGKTLSPRLSLSYALNNQWNLNASVGRYYKIPPYTILGFANNQNNLVNKNADYLQSDHFVTGLEYIPNNALRFTLEGFYKKYRNVPVSVRNGISLSNLGSDFDVLGNEAVTTNGKGKAYGFEFFAQKKLTNKMFGILSYTFYRSLYSGTDEKFIPSSWDNKHLLSVTWGYKFPRNWELGLKFRYQGAAPYTPYDETASRLNYLSLGQGVLDFNKLNTQRLASFNSSDVRIDKKWNFKKLTLDLFLDVSNWYKAKSSAPDSYTFKRTDDNSAFLTTDGQPIKANGSNGIPVRIKNDEPRITPTIGFIVEF